MKNQFSILSSLIHVLIYICMQNKKKTKKINSSELTNDCRHENYLFSAISKCTHLNIKYASYTDYKHNTIISNQTTYIIDLIYLFKF